MKGATTGAALAKQDAEQKMADQAAACAKKPKEAEETATKLANKLKDQEQENATLRRQFNGKFA